MKTKIVLLASLLLSITAFSQKLWTLKECVDYALENNITVKQNELNIEVAQADVKSARAGFLPNLNASTSGNLSAGTNFDPVTNTRTPSTTFFGGNVGLNSGITIFNGYRVLNTYKQAQLGVEGSKIDLKTIENDISLRVINTYLNVLFAKENLEVAKIQAEISKNQINQSQAQFEAGAIPKSDLLNAQSTAANDAQNVVTQENALNLALLNLSQLLQIPFEGFDVTAIKVDSPSSALLYSSSNEVYQKALTNWPEIERAKLNIKNAELSIDIAKSGYLPNITGSLFANSNYRYVIKPKGFESGALFDQLDGNLGYGVGLNVNIPIFNGFRNDANVERSKVNKLISETQLLNQKLQLEQTIEQAYQDAKAAAKAYEAAQISLEAQKEAFKNAQESYNYGAMTLFDFDLVRNRLVNAESAMIRAKYNYVFTTKVLKFYYGENILD